MREKIGIVVCSRTDSKRCPNKPFIKLNGKYLISHLLDRLIATGLPVYLAVPKEEHALYEKKLEGYINWKNVFLFGGSKNDPLKRTHQVAKHYDLKHVIRVCHDKIFISYRQIEYFLTRYLEGKFEYVYSTNFIPGMGFEVFSAAILAKAHATFENVEHLSYAVESVAKNVLKLLQFPQSRTWLNRVKPHCGLRLLIDFPEDVEAVEALMIKNGNNCDIQDIVSSIGNKPQPNAMPDITVYTCSFEDTEFLDRCINSVLSQSFYNFEYILLDDGSKKNEVHKFMRRYRKDKRVRVLRNRENIGLASSSNVATKAARGRYVIRLDADDHFVDERVLERMARHMEINNTDILYPHNYKDGRIQHGSEQHHVGGAMFKRRMLEFIRFTDGLRHYDGLDLYYRAMTASARIDYFDEPTFYYRQRANSMSKSKSNARMEIGGKIKKGVVGNALLEGEK